MWFRRNSSGISFFDDLKMENIYADETAQAVPEIFKENIAAFGNKQVFDMVRVALDMLEDVAENRIRHTGSIVMVCRRS